MKFEPGWLDKALEAASERASDMPHWLKREERLREEANSDAAKRAPNCEHRPMKAALDDWVGCKLCGAWISRSH